MTITGEYIPSPSEWVRKQVEMIAETGTTGSVDIQGLPVVLLTMLGAKSGSVRKVPLMRVEHDGAYAAVASQGGAPEHPQWYHNLRKHPDLDLQVDTETFPVHARVVEGEEREAWWQRCVEAFPDYAGYQVKTERQIPVFVLEHADH
ncbi:MAG: nitroreductase family deazaflavin-dependent oxidoreductase [Terracoccus sp.]